MTPQVLSIFNNAKTFLSNEELRDLALCIEKEIGKAEKPKQKKPKSAALEAWTLEAVTEMLLATTFRPRSKRNKVPTQQCELPGSIGTKKVPCRKVK